MTVGELVTKLLTVDSNLPVYVWCEEWRCWDLLEDVDLKKVHREDAVGLNGKWSE